MAVIQHCKRRNSEGYKLTSQCCTLSVNARTSWSVTYSGYDSLTTVSFNLVHWSNQCEVNKAKLVAFDLIMNLIHAAYDTH